MVAQFLDERLPQRFWDKVTPEPNSGCWIWLACVNADGYGQFRWGGRAMPGAHRVAYQMLVGVIPDGLVIDHLCRTRCCVNPAHLEPVTDAENFRRGTPAAWKQLATTHCPSGHPYNESNTAHRGGRRHCRECERARCRRYHAANRAKENERSRRYYATRHVEAVMAAPDAREAEPPVSIAHGFEGSCEACGVLVQVGDPVHVYADDVVIHERCPGSRERAQA